MKPLRITDYTLTSAVGEGRAAHLAALRTQRTGLSEVAFETCSLATWLGQVAGLATPISGELADWDCRNNRLALLALQQDGFLQSVERLRRRYGAHRVGVFLGTSTSGIHQTELAYQAREHGIGDDLPHSFDFGKTQNIFSCGDFVRRHLRLDGIAHVTSTACSSSAKAFASAYRALHCGLCDAAVVGGVDSLCLTTLYGFNALQLLSADICRPADAQRSGISIGEAAGFAIVEFADTPGLALLGYGESSDAHHMSTPDPAGRGALAAMIAALHRAGLAPADIGYVNLHGTATPSNDLAEDKAVCALLGTRTPCSSTKGWTGHTLGAAGIVEAAISLLVIEHELLPRSLNTRQRDGQIRGAILMENRDTHVASAISNSFGFGGSNCSLLFGVQR
ncbi:beta-ketoacyl-ACP synthase [Panacagrimonas sp.]|uniref:beta-ketoacyl-ACP synthase n=1 Tax=Panacagrimonas sp. TaxID=2480088 RepID=UPI003B52B87C